MTSRTLFTLIFALLTGVTAADPALDAKAALGGVIESAQGVQIGPVLYLLVAQRPYVNGEQRILVLKPFAGKYTVYWRSPPYFGNSLLGTGLTDLNHDGIPEVYLANEDSGNQSGIETYTLTDLANNMRYAVEVDFLQDGTPGTILPGKMLDSLKASPFRAFLEARVAKSKRLLDTRNAFTKASNIWYERYGSFLNEGAHGPIVVAPVSAAYDSELCLNAVSPMAKTISNGIEYRALFKFGVMSFNPATQRCAVLLATPGDSPSDLRVTKGEIYISLGYSGNTVIWNPKQQTLRWK